MANGGDGAEVLFTDRIAALNRVGQQQNFFLDVRGKVQKVRDLRDSHPGHVRKMERRFQTGFLGTHNGLGPLGDGHFAVDAGDMIAKGLPMRPIVAV